MDFRQKAANHLANLAGEKTLIDDLSMIKVINMMVNYGRECASYGWDSGRTHQVTSEHPDNTLFKASTKEQFLESNFKIVTPPQPVEQ